MKCTHSILFFLLLLSLSAGSASDTSTQNDTSKSIWDLSLIYRDQNEWETERKVVMDKIGTIGQLKNKMTKSAKAFADGMEEVSDLRARAGKLAVYGFLVSDTNTTSERAKHQLDVGNNLEIQVESAVSFMNSEIRALGKQRIDEWMAQEPRLTKFRARINRIFAELPYSLDPKSEAILKSAQRWPLLSGDIWQSLHESDLGWPDLGSEPAPSKLNRAAYLNFRNTAHTTEKVTQLYKYLHSLDRLKDVFGILYTRRIEADLILAKHRGFHDGIEALWFLRDEMPSGSFQVMIDQTRRHLDLLQRFARLRARVLKSRQPSYTDLFSPIDSNQHFSLAEAKQIAIKASGVFGEEYVKALRDRMNQPWMHLASLPEKRNTYAIWPPVGRIPPYFIMTYEGTYDHARRFLGAMTLMMSFAEWGKVNAPDTRDDSGIYSNAIIYVGDMLFDDDLIQKAATKDEKIFSLVSSLDLLRHHYFHWAMNSEFDARVQTMIEKGETPTGSTLSDMYLNILKEYYEDNQRGVFVEQPFGNEWMINSVPFFSYEHQFWPASMAAACNVVEGLRNEDPNAAKAVWQVLGRSDTDRTYGLLKEAGLDLTEPKSYEPVFMRTRRLLDQLELLAR